MPSLPPLRRFACPDTWHDLVGGYESVPVGTKEEVLLSLRAFAATTLEGRGIIPAPPSLYAFNASTLTSAGDGADGQARG